MTEAVTVAFRERLEREQARRKAAAGLPSRIAAFSGRSRAARDTRPVSKAEGDAASGDDQPALADDT
jgi:hypothetical protein